jgi:hypothetical protein
MKNVFSFHNFGEYVRLEKYQKFYGFLVFKFKPPSSNPNFQKLSRAHKTSIKNISASLKFYKMGHEAQEWPRLDLGSFELGAPDPTTTNIPSESSVWNRKKKEETKKSNPKEEIEVPCASYMTTKRRSSLRVI